MQNPIQKMYQDKKEYREQMARIKVLPEDYQFVFHKLQNYMWSWAGGSGYDMLKTQYNLIELFESGAAQGKPVLEVTGEDVATFCDELIKDNKLWIHTQRDRLNRKMNKQAKKSKGL